MAGNPPPTRPGRSTPPPPPPGANPTGGAAKLPPPPVKREGSKPTTGEAVGMRPGSTRPAVFDADNARSVTTEVVDKNAKRGPSRRALLIGAGGALLAGGGLYAALKDDGSSPVPQPVPTETLESLPGGVSAPGGWKAAARWSLTDVAYGTPVAVGGMNVFAVTTDENTGNRSLTMVHGKDGKTAWSSPLPAGLSLRNGPVVSTLDGRPFVFVRTTSTLMGWPADGSTSKPRTWDAPDMGILPTPSGLILQYGGSSDVGVIQGNSIKRIKVESKFYPTELLDSGKALLTLSSDGRARIYGVKDGKKGAEKKLAGVKDTSPGTWLWSRNQRVYSVWVPKGDGASSIIRCYDRAHDYKPVWTTPPISLPVDPWHTAWADGQDWAMMNGTWIDFTTGDTRGVSSDFVPVAYGPDYVWSVNKQNNVLTVLKDGSLLPADPKIAASQVAMPVGQCGEMMLATSSIGGSSTLFALPRDPDYKQVKPGKLAKATKN